MSAGRSRYGEPKQHDPARQVPPERFLSDRISASYVDEIAGGRISGSVWDEIQRRNQKTVSQSTPTELHKAHFR